MQIHSVMKRILVFVFIVMVNSGFCQDIIIFRSGDEVNGKVLEVTGTVIKIKTADNPDGPVYVYKVSELLMIRYANGQNDIFAQPRYRRNNPPKIYFISDTSYKPRNRVVSYLFRAGYEYGHDEQHYYYWGLGNAPFFFTENSFLAEALIGTRGRYYQYAAGLGAYFQNFNYSDARDFNGTLVQKKVYNQNISFSLTFANRLYFSQKKIAPFIMVDVCTTFGNVIRIRNTSPDNRYSGNYSSWDWLMGGGVELKTKTKYKLQFEIGFRKRDEANIPSDISLFHSGICLLY